MRVKTDERRQAIIDAATDVFREAGYERTTMAEISRRVGGSKATLYGYFPSKEELFATAMTEAVDAQSEALLAMLNPADPDIATILRRLGEGYLQLVTSPDVFTITRAAVAEGANSGLGEMLYARGPQKGTDQLADYLALLMEKGVLRQSDARIAAVQLKALFEAGIHEPMLFGAKPTLDARQVIDAAVDTFLRAYGVAGGTSGQVTP